MIRAIETHYAGCRFRSRLEARWAVFFDALSIAWEYEPQGYELSTGRRYLPDFLLPECGTWIEVKGSDAQLDRELIVTAALELPRMANGDGETGPKLMVLGPMPEPPGVRFQTRAGPYWEGDWGWAGLTSASDGAGVDVDVDAFGFGPFGKNRRPWWLDNAQYEWPCAPRDAPWTKPLWDCSESGAQYAYTKARSARFEHGERG